LEFFTSSLQESQLSGDFEMILETERSVSRSYVHSFRIIHTTTQHPTEFERKPQTNEERRTKDGARVPDPSPGNSTDASTTGDVQTPSEPSDTVDKAAKESRSARKQFLFEDPLSWYGILVPQSLRSAQRSFTAASDEFIPELVSVITEMRLVEERVNTVRKQLCSSS
jgi:coiled-coil domain-containing protein 115